MNKTVVGGALLALCALVASLVVTAPAAAGVSCHKINAKGVGQDLGGGLTQARITGGGLLNGTTAGSFAITGFTPPALASIAGTVTFTVNKATLVVSVTGTFDVASGAFSASGPVTGATGKLADATGSLNLNGIEDLTDGSFVEDVVGSVCVDLSP
jgi:hypothetical protein